jgi:hypothetical protein
MVSELSMQLVSPIAHEAFRDTGESVFAGGDHKTFLIELLTSETIWSLNCLLWDQ